MTRLRTRSRDIFHTFDNVRGGERPSLAIATPIREVTTESAMYSYMWSEFVSIPPFPLKSARELPKSGLGEITIH